MVSDFLISTLIAILDNTILRFFPVEIQGLPIGEFESLFHDVFSTFSSSFDMIQYFFDIGLLFKLLGIIMLAEFLLHFGFKGIKYLINLVRGSGG
ncbi:MAG: hypothetical protein PHU32_05450 [Candidatus ainarchaeum sp.]|nr:hypothetical protein [Candidatus ainarchaeum sp.]